MIHFPSAKKRYESLKPAIHGAWIFLEGLAFGLGVCVGFVALFDLTYVLIRGTEFEGWPAVGLAFTSLIVSRWASLESKVHEVAFATAPAPTMPSDMA